MNRSRIEAHIVRTICQNYFGGKKDDGCENCLTKVECNEIINETFTYIEHISSDRKNVA